MEPSTQRRPILSDLVVLIVAVALGIAMGRRSIEWLSSGIADHMRPKAAIFWYKFTVIYPLILPATILIAWWAPRRSGLRLREAIKSPGIAACAAASAAFLLIGLAALPDFLSRPTFHVGPVQAWDESSRQAGYAVIGAWVVAGLRRPTDGVIPWLDRMGLILGALWAFASALGVVTHVIIRWGYGGAEFF